ncbi:hypothetical protein BS47DRAFT_1482341 [Hydnum rufescens UP504]|uniref:Uncharacterized protein n=1 Tax=Hydnum rufescens UP504 TaxID=1448309 RepID=A0A9P6E1D8_9AGAM|nr:hypothetical protein BS47DRAFT_1482341 [Hydnum rufescens UP504]
MEHSPPSPPPSAGHKPTSSSPAARTLPNSSAKLRFHHPRNIPDAACVEAASPMALSPVELPPLPNFRPISSFTVDSSPSGVTTAILQLSPPFSSVLIAPCFTPDYFPLKFSYDPKLPHPPLRTTMHTDTTISSRLSKYFTLLIPVGESPSLPSSPSPFSSVFQAHQEATGLRTATSDQKPSRIHTFLDRPSSPYVHILAFLRSITASVRPTLPEIHFKCQLRLPLAWRRSLDDSETGNVRVLPTEPDHPSTGPAIIPNATECITSSPSNTFAKGLLVPAVAWAVALSNVHHRMSSALSTPMRDVDPGIPMSDINAGVIQRHAASPKSTWTKDSLSSESHSSLIRPSPSNPTRHTTTIDTVLLVFTWTSYAWLSSSGPPVAFPIPVSVHTSLLDSSVRLSGPVGCQTENSQFNLSERDMLFTLEMRGPIIYESTEDTG